MAHRHLQPTSLPRRLLLPALLAASASTRCVDTSIPDLSNFGTGGRTDGPFCSPEDMAEFPAEELRLHFIDVGQGDAIWIQTPWYESELLESKNILIDAGPSGNVPGTSPGGAVVVDYLLRNGLDLGERLDALVITHAHEDHYGGLEDIVSSFEVARYIDPGFDGGSSGFVQARSVATAEVQRLSGQVSVPAVPGLVPQLFASTLLFGEFVQAEVLWAAEAPPSGNISSPSGTDINNTSVAFSLQWANRQVLLLGDLEQEVEAQLVAAHDRGEINLTSSVIKAGHHGSSSSSTPSFLSRIFPQKSADNWAIISSGRRSFSGVTLPTEDTLTNLAAVLMPFHILSTENLDGPMQKAPGTEHGDDHILVRINSDGRVEACYAF